MLQIKNYHILTFLDKIFVIFLLVLGNYFIYMGDIIPKFLAERTNFAVYSETMNELPTVSTYLSYEPANFTLGIDFNMSFSGQVLKMGRNDVQRSNLTVNFEHVMVGKKTIKGRKTPDHWYRIQPMNFSSGMQVAFEVEYSFASQKADLPEIEIGLFLTNRNNSLCWCMGKYFDGEKVTVLAKVGNWFRLGLQPQKFIYRQKDKGCREKPCAEEFVQKLEAEIPEKYGTLCKPQDLVWECAALIESRKVNQLPECHKKSEETQFQTIMVKVEEKIQAQPCTKLQYQIAEQGPWSVSLNRTTFSVVMKNPYETIVNEEYIIYDMVSMISAIGGTLGLCIGFSFKECGRDIMAFCFKVFEVIIKHSSKKVNPPHHSIKNPGFNLQLEKEEFPSLVNMKAELMKQCRKMDELQYEHSNLKTQMAQYEKKLREFHNQ